MRWITEINQGRGWTGHGYERRDLNERANRGEVATYSDDDGHRYWLDLETEADKITGEQCNDAERELVSFFKAREAESRRGRRMYLTISDSLTAHECEIPDYEDLFGDAIAPWMNPESEDYDGDRVDAAIVAALRRREQVGEGTANPSGYVVLY